MKKEAENRKRKIKETMEQQENKQQDKYLNGIMSIVTLNANRLNTPSKRYRLAEWIQNQDQYSLNGLRKGFPEYNSI